MQKLLRNHKVAVIGAGFSGLGIAESLKRHGIDYDQYDRNDQPGGLWYRGVYHGAHLITPKSRTGYLNFPMPDDYPDFPSRAQIREYLLNFAHHHGLLESIRFGTVVQKVEPIENGLQWKLHFDTGSTKHYDSVVIATGHHWDPFLPVVDGEFCGQQLHSSDYNGAEIFRGKRVLIVGGGNSAADLAVAAAGVGKSAHISMRGGHWFLPKTLFGRPTGEILKPWFPRWAIRFFLAVAVGDYRRYGLVRPRHRLFDEDPTINDSLLNDLKHGRIKALPAVRRLDGDMVEFVDGRREAYDLICWATGFNVSVPCVAEGVIPVKNNVPDIAMGMYAPRHKNLYIFGLGHLLKPIPRYGVGPMISAGADVLSLSIILQQKIHTPLGIVWGKLVRKPDRYSVGPTLALQMTKLLAWFGGKALAWIKPEGRHGQKGADTAADGDGVVRS